MGLKRNFDATLSALEPGVRIYIAYSGGLDSHCLLHLTAGWAAQHGREVAALHMNHGLSPDAEAWQGFCERECRRLGVKFLYCEAPVDREAPGSLEQRARDTRYAWFESVLEGNDVLLMAHHREDQAETLLLRLLRGAGTRGLSAIPASRRLGKGRILRPVLDSDRDDLRAYAVLQGLEWIEDESNLCLDIDRNYLRHQVMPILRERWPRASRQFARSAGNLRDELSLLDELAELDAQGLRSKDLASCMDVIPPLELPGFRSLSAIRQRNLLQYLLKGVTIYPLPAERMREWLRQVNTAADTGKARLLHENLQVALYDGRMHFLAAVREREATERPIEWCTDVPLQLPDLGLELRLSRQAGQGPAEAGDLSFKPGDTLYVHWRRGGERVKLPGESFSRSLKKLLQDRRIAPWMRNLMPLVSCKGCVVWSAALGDFYPRLVEANGQVYSFKLVANDAN